MSNDLKGKENYYAVIPMFILMDDDLPNTAKLLYGEISALTNKKGYCYAGNQYLADVFSSAKNTISRNLRLLKKRGYIEVEVDPKQGNKRVIKLGGVCSPEYTPLPKNEQRGMLKNEQTYIYEENNKDNIENNIYIKDLANEYSKLVNSRSRLTDKAKKKIRKRLETYSKEELIEAMENFSANDWWMKNNSGRGIAWFFHSDDRIDQFLNLDETNDKPKFKSYG